ncbi:MAG: hypothetical protein H5T69_10345 [Chloroflexi bacterium]|nr:hypothetical protein [Chloroflexota bacterium]
MKEHEQALRAVRSYERNRRLIPKVEERLQKARGILEAFLLRSGQDQARLGDYQIERKENGDLAITKLPPEGWEQLEFDHSGFKKDRPSPPARE